MSELTNRPGRPVRRPDRRHAAGVLDIRNIIGGLLATYGVILLAMGLFADTQPDKTGGVNANLWAGLALLVVGLVFIGWARWRPLLVPDTSAQGAQDAQAPRADQDAPRGGSTAE